MLLITKLIIGQEIVYLRSTTGTPWGRTTNEEILNNTFGEGNWQELRYETVDVSALLASNVRYIFMEGSDRLANELESFLTTHIQSFENWVRIGGVLFINAGSGEGDGMSFGFGGIELNYPNSANSVEAADLTHPIFNGPFLPVGNNWTGSSFSHASVSGPDLIPLVVEVGNPSEIILGEKKWGAGKVFFGGMTLPNFHNPNPEAENLRKNILSITVSNGFNDAGISEIKEPINFCSGNHDIVVTLENFGRNNIDNVNINWEFNGSPQTVIPYTTPLDSAGGNQSAADIVLGNKMFDQNQTYDIKIWTSSPNGEQDTINKNDTIQVSLKASLSGNYTIGGSSPDFASIGEAITSIEQTGVCGPIVFNIRSGNYNEQLIIPEIIGVSETNTITFQSESGDSTDVVITYSSDDWNENFTVRLDGADYTIFKNLTMEATGQDYATVVEFRNGAGHNQFLNNIIKGLDTGRSWDEFTIIKSGSNGNNKNNNNNVFVGNNIMFGSTAISMISPNNDYMGSGLIIKNNTFTEGYYRAIYLREQRNVEIASNTIVSNSEDYFYAMYFYNCEDSLMVTKNKISITNDGYGIYMDNVYDEEVSSSVTNNFISVEGSSSAIGIYYRYSSGIKYLHNNVLVRGSGEDNKCLYLYYVDETSVLNNIFVNESGGHVFYVRGNEGGAGFSSDYNDLYTTGDYIAYFDQQVASLLDWQTLSGMDANSVSVNPSFTSTSDLHVKKAILDGKAIPSSITDDIDGEPRNLSTPDIGADEFEPSGADATLVTIGYPESPFDANAYDINVTIKNSGINTLTGATIYWEVNGNAQTEKAWSGNLSTGNSESVLIGNYNFENSTLYNIKAWVADPNGGIDIDNNDDTLSVSNIYAALPAGAYTVGGTSPDFTTLNDAVYALNYGGISGSVIFNIRDGSYDEQVVLSEIIGANSENTVTFQSESGDSTAVIVSYAANYSNNYVIKLDGADYVTFKNLTLKSLGTSYCRVIELTNGSSNNHFSNNVIEGVNSTSSSDYRAVIYSSGGSVVNSNDHNNTFTQNAIRNGSYGFYLIGYGSETGFLENNLVISNNNFTDQYYRSIYLRFQNSPIVEQNNIETNTAYNTFYGILINYSYDNVLVSGNKINIPNGGAGIHTERVYGDDVNRVNINNNFIHVGGTSSSYSYGIYTYQSQFLNIYHNNVNITSTDPDDGMALYLSSGENHFVLNNVLVNTGGGYGVFYSNSSVVQNSDYNDIYVSGNKLGLQSESTYQNLSSWQNVTSHDEHSYSVNPIFSSATDLHINKGVLNNTAIPLVEVTEDIDGETRNVTTPDIGADEFSPTGVDASLVYIEYSDTKVGPGSQPVHVVIKNSGGDALTSATINWSVSDTVQVPYNWNGTLANGETDTINIGNYNFNFNTAYDIAVTVKDPNGSADIDTIDNFLEVTDFHVSLGGTYTIGGTTPDFNTFQEAIDALNIGGVWTPTVFNVRDGDYNEQISINELEGTSLINTITFQSESGDSTTVSLSFNSTINSANYTLQLNGADHIIFKNMSLKAENASRGRVIDILNDANHNQFFNNRIEGYSTTSTSDYMAVIYSQRGSSEDDNNDYEVFKNNLILNGSYGLYGRGYNNQEGTRELNLQIENNIFENQYYYGIDLIYHENSVIKNNTITTNSSRNSFKGIYLYYAYDSTTVVGNKINIANGGYGIHIYYGYSSVGKEALIANNFILIGGVNASTYGIYLNRAEYYNIFHNTVNITTTEREGTYGLYNYSGTGNNLINNIFANSGEGYAIYINSASEIASSDYNNFYTKGDNLAKLTDDQVDLAAWQNASGFDANSLSIDPRFISDTDLHVREIALYNAGSTLPSLTVDVDGEPRDANPDIGADEFTPALNDASAFEVANPVMPFQSGEQMVSVVLKNSGLNALNSVDIYWSVNDAVPDVVNWNDELLSSDSTIVQLGNYTFDPFVAYKIKVWTVNPNGGLDADLTNDTITVVNQYSGLEGNYTICGTAPDFNTFTDAVTALSNGGVFGPTTFSVRSGEYIEQINIPELVGSSEGNTVLFTSESGDSTDVTLTYTLTGSSTNYVVQLDGADYITFQNLTLKSVNNSYGRVVSLINGVEHCSFVNNIIQGVNATTTSDYMAAIYSRSFEQKEPNSYNEIINNHITDGSYGIVSYGFDQSLGNRNVNTLIKDNTIENVYYQAIYLAYQDGVEISANTIYTENGDDDFNGIRLAYSYNALKVLQNKINISNGGYGIRLNQCIGAPGTDGLIANNFISIKGSYFSIGIYLDGCEYRNVYHNNVNILSTNINGSAFRSYWGNSNKLLNNILANNAGNMTVQFDGVDGIAESDYNNFYTEGEILGKWDGNNVTDLTALQTLSGLDANSLSINPGFVSDSNLHVKEVRLNNSGTPLTEVPEDIDNETRDITNPDIGADEFTPETTDAGIISLDSPTMPFELGVQEVKVSLRNFGLDSLKTATINWSVNDTILAEVNWVGELESGDTTQVVLGNYDFRPGTEYWVKAWTVNPNGLGDNENTNDTVLIENIYSALKGYYTIGGTSPDFDTISHAINALVIGGVIDSAIFNIRTGTYNEQLIIPEIVGSSSYNTIIFQAESGINSDVSVIYNANSIDKYTILLDRADGVTFRNMSIGAINNDYGNVVDLRNGAEYNTFDNVILNGINTTSNSSYLAIVNSLGYSDNDNYNRFQNCQFNDGSYGIYYYGYRDDNRENGNLIENNLFKNQFSYAINVVYQGGVQINKNDISTNKTNNGYRGIFARYCRNEMKITRNKIYGASGGTGIYLEYTYGTSGNKNLVANNFIQLGSNSNTWGIYTYRCDYTNIYHNSINITSTSTSTNNTAIYLNRGNSNYLRNNIFVNSGNGYAINQYNAGFISDFNNLYTTGEKFAYYNGDRNDFAAWQNASNRDQHSVSADPFFYSETDLHVYSSLLNAVGTHLNEVSDDIDGNPRSVTPDIGADEFIPPTEDASIINIDKPSNSMKAGYNDVYVQLLNNASADLNSVSIFWKINGNFLPTYNWTGTLESSKSDSVKLGSYEFLPNTEYEIVAWTYQPNGLTDKVPSNDTSSVSGLYAGMLGEYVIGSDTADFPNFTQAVQALHNQGIAGNVVFKVADGIYNEQISINEVNGLSEENQITFESGSGDSSKVTLNYSPSSGTNYTLKINGADYLNFRNITLGTTGGTYGRVVEISNESNYLSFNNVVFNGSTYSSTFNAYYRAIIYSNSSQNQYNTFTKCIFNNGGYAFYYNGESTSVLSSGTVIENNVFEDQYAACIYLGYQLKPKVNNNSIITFANISGVEFHYCDGNFEIKTNTISINNNGTGIYLNNCDGTSNNRGEVINNFIFVSTGNAKGIYTNTSRYLNIFHNNVHISSTNTSSGMVFYNQDGANIQILNNVFANSGGGYAYYNTTTSAITNSDYNDLYTTGVNLARWGTVDQPSLSALNMISGFEANSYSVDPQFESSTDLHVNQPNLDGAATPIEEVVYDYDGQIRQAGSPDIGADEFGAGLLTNDIGVIALIEPQSACVLSGSETITVRVQNHGVDTIKAFDITYIVNDTIIVTEAVENFNLKGGNNKDYSFTNPLDMEDHGFYEFVVYTSLPGDTINQNDTLSNITIEHYPIVKASVSNDTIICSHTQASLIADGGNTYEWRVLGSTGVLSYSKNYYPSLSNKKTYVVTAYNNFGCYDKDTVEVDVMPTPETPSIDIIGSISACNDDTIRLESSIPDNILWSTGDVTQSIEVFEPGSYHVTHIDTVTGCNSRRSITLSYFSQPYLDVSDGSICEGSGQSVSIRVINGASYTWSTGETTQSISVTPTETTTYSVLIVNSEGCEYERAATISVMPGEPAPEIYSISDDTEVCSGSQVTLSVTGNASEYQWSTGQKGRTISVYPTATSTYSVTARNGECSTGSATDEVTVTALPLPEAPIIVATGSSNLSFCDADTIKLTSSDFTDSLLWSTGETTPQIVTTDPGVYSVSLINEFGCSNVSSVTLTDPPVPYITGKNTVCEGESTILAVNNGDFYVWSTSDSTRSIEVTPSETTKYYVDIQNKEGCSYTDSIKVTILPMPKISGISADTTICNGEEIKLNVVGTADRFTWTDGQEGSTITVTPTETTVYGVTATNGCTLNNFNDHGDLTVTVLPLPSQPVISPADTIIICEAATTELTSSESDNIIWSTGETTQIITVDEPGDYVLTHSSELGCTLSDQVTVIHTPKANIIAQGFETICRGDSITLSVENATTYNWSTGETTQSIVVHPLDTTTYTVSGENTLACSYSDEITINLIDPVPPEVVANLVPDNETNDLSLPLSLSWTPSNNATHYDIYVWKDSTEIPTKASISNLDQISYLYKGGLSYGQTYNWQVNAENSCYTIEGNAQTFILRELPDLVVKKVKTPKSVFSGQSIDISWEVENIGKGNTEVKESWNEAVYLSPDSILEIHVDKYLGGIPNLTALNSGQSYSKTSTFKLPKGITGEYYVFVVADKFGAVRESNEVNNGQKNSPSMLVKLTPPPDLRVVQVVTPANTFSGQQIDISWTVKNKGTGLAEINKWDDRVYISSDSLLRTSSATNLGTFSHSGQLEPDEEYTVHKTVTVPDAVFGTYYIHVKTDVYDKLFEHAFENNNVGGSDEISVILAPPSDLLVTEITVQDSASNNESISISWTVQNQGASPTDVSNWTDRIYISEETTFKNDKAKQIGATTNYLNLGLGEEYTKSKEVRIPDEITGPHYIYVHADADNRVFEYENDDNNLERSSSIIEILSPDIIVSQVTPIDSAMSGELIPINWIVKNVGEGILYNTKWKDRISSDNSAIFNADSLTLVKNKTYNSGLILPGDSISLQAEGVLPEGISGNNFIHVEANAEKDLYEQPKGEKNNNFGPIYVTLSPWADLEITDMETPVDTVTAGTSLPFNITVTNTGFAETKSSAWVDQIYISQEPEVTADTTFIKEIGRDKKLLLDSSYLIDTKINLSAYLPEGEYYFHVFIDYNDEIYEHTDEGNNIKTYGPIYVNAYPPVDLAMDTVIVSDSLSSGKEYDIKWVTQNIGQAPTLANYWYDALYLSKDTIWNGHTDLHIKEWPIYGPMDVMEQFTENQKFKIPDGMSGDYYLMMVADYSKISDSTQYTIDSNRVNNLKMVPIHIELTPSPDLQITTFEAPNQGYSGQPIQVEWTVTNNGAGPTNKSWTDKIYLSTDFEIDEYDDLKLYGEKITNSLDTGETYSFSVNVPLPMSAEGNYILLIKTDNNDIQYEHNAEDNNIASSLITITRPLPADLVITDIVAPDNAKAGKSVYVEWTVQNTGTNPAKGVMQDIVYFSEDEIWDINDAVLGTVEYNINLAPLSSETRGLNAQLNNVKTGDYHVIVRTDSKNNIYESDEDNNELTSSNKVSVNVDELKLYVLTHDTLGANTYTYYRIEIADSLTNETLLLTLNGNDDTGTNELYIKYGESPTRNEYDDAFDNPFTGDQEVVVPNMIPGTYYVLVYGNLSDQPVELYASILNFEIRSIETDEGGNTGSVTSIIEGAKFSPDMELFLERGDIKIHASQIQFIDPTTVHATFDLTDAELGFYDVVAVDSLENIAILFNGYTVVQGTEYMLETNFEYPASTRPGALVVITLQFGNGGNVDIPTPIRSMVSRFGAPLGFSINDLKYFYKDLYIEFNEPGGPEGVLRPGAISSVTVYTRAVRRLLFKIMK